MANEKDTLINQRHMRMKQCRHGVMLYNINDMYVGRSLDLYGEFSEGEAAMLGQILRPGMVVCDIGANIGCHTVFQQLNLCSPPFLRRTVNNSG